MQTQALPRRLGRPRKSPSQFPGTVIPFSSRQRFVIGDVVELCRGCLPGNRGKLAVVTGFDDKGYVLFRSLWQSLDSVDSVTGVVTLASGVHGRALPENLYRRSKDILRGMMMRALP